MHSHPEAQSAGKVRESDQQHQATESKVSEPVKNANACSRIGFVLKCLELNMYKIRNKHTHIYIYIYIGIPINTSTCSCAFAWFMSLGFRP